MIYCVKIPKSHPRKWVECSDPTYRGGGFEIWESHQRQLVDGSDPTYLGGRFEIWESHPRQLVDGSDPTCSSKHIAKSKGRYSGNALGRFVSERQDLNNPPTAVGGIYRSPSRLIVERI
jgi:hypothetical protein